MKVVYIPPEAEEDGTRKEIVARVKREIDALGQCRTNRLVTLGSQALERISVGGRDYLIYSEELLPGESSRQRLRTLPYYQELRVLTQCLMEALQAIEQSGHIHRDIKPDNVMATGLPERPFVVSGPGHCFQAARNRADRAQRGAAGAVIYMAPELFQPQYKDVLDIRSDIYSAGVTVFEYAAGSILFIGPARATTPTVYRILNQQPAKLAVLRADLPGPFCQLVDRCFKRRPALRYSNPAAVLRELETII